MSATPTTKNDYAYTEIRRRILLGELAAGTAIPQAVIAAELGLSTTPLREAIRRLSAEGLVEVTAHRDARVTPVTVEEARHLYEVREHLDPLATRLAAQRRTDSEVVEIERRLEALSPLHATSDLDGLLAHRAFHRAIYHAGHNPILSTTLDQLWDKADRYRVVTLQHSAASTSDRERVAAEHQALYEAVRDQREDDACDVMRSHIRHSLGRRAVELLAETGH